VFSRWRLGIKPKDIAVYIVKTSAEPVHRMVCPCFWVVQNLFASVVYIPESALAFSFSLHFACYRLLWLLINGCVKHLTFIRICLVIFSKVAGTSFVLSMLSFWALTVCELVGIAGFSVFGLWNAWIGTSERVARSLLDGLEGKGKT
jgi:hypothetical protein